MITIEIPKKELLRQLPEQAGYALMQWFDQMPDTFILQGLPAKTREEVVIEKYPWAPGLLTPIELQLLISLCDRGKVNRTSLMYELKLEDERGFLSNSNVLDVHVKNLRIKIRENKLPLRVITFEKSAFNVGSYKLVEIK